MLILNYEFSLYVFQQFIVRSLYIGFYLTQPSFAFYIFVSGLITGCSPCIISILPLVFAYININSKKKIEIF
uniref:Cytochrome c biogenesis protein transmembrane region n=1 Tax=Corallina chilensis TaxID=2582857 RepID=A0A4P8VUP9_9FLOR|nr:cytochrome c biogenesis protein transmembrane region [Corallina chilensis]QCS25470.1 cytochrome c biogenesis protein transmembrane region [Corallina chilensis]